MYSSRDDPITYEEACEDEKWVKAIEVEIATIDKNQTQELVKAPPEAKPIGVKWVFKTKINEKGEVDKHKARLVIKVMLKRKVWTMMKFCSCSSLGYYQNLIGCGCTKKLDNLLARC